MFSGPLVALTTAALAVTTLQAPAADAQPLPRSDRSQAQGAAAPRHGRSARAARSPRSTPTPPGSACRCSSRAATPSTPRSPPPPRSASPSPTAPASAAAATSSTTTRRSRRCKTLDGRETAPAAMKHDAFIDPATGKPYTFTPDLVTSGVSVGVPGTPATWQARARPLGHRCRWPTSSTPAADLARARLRGRQDLQPADRRQRRAVQHLHLDPQAVPAARQGARRSAALLPQPRARRHLRPARASAAWRRSTAATLARELAKTVRKPPMSGRTDLPVPKGKMRAKDLAKYERHPAPAHARRLPRARRLRHAAVLQRRHHRRRGAQHPRALRPEVAHARCRCSTS